MKSKTHPVQALVPQREDGHQFVCYADCCSGVRGAHHEETFAAVNSVVARLEPQPEFICFPGDEIQGLANDRKTLRQQWRYWFEHEMRWLKRKTTPLYHTPGNHTVYDALSAEVYREVMAHLPHNGPPEQKGLSYFVRREDLVMVFVNTLWSGLGGEGRVETEWLDQTLGEHADARFKLVLGHHPVHSVNGFSGACQREILPQDGRTFWETLVRHNVLAYICSHILAFDVQVHKGVLQILTGGAGTMPRMPEGIEYLHAVQAALDAKGLRYQVLDTSGEIREWLKWPVAVPPSATWRPFEGGESRTPAVADSGHEPSSARFAAWSFSGICSDADSGEPQTLLSGWTSDQSLASLWVGLRGPEQRLSALMSNGPGRSPHLWLGPGFAAGEPLEFQFGVHTGMGPGGLMWRWNDNTPWSSLKAASPWGAEMLAWPRHWSVGHGQHDTDVSPFRGRNLEVTEHTRMLRL